MTKKDKPIVRNDHEITWNNHEIKVAHRAIRAVNHKLRRRIIAMLEQNATLTVTDIYIRLRLEQSVASQHLAILRREGVVLDERQGKFIYYSLDRDRIKQIQKAMGGFEVEQGKN